CLHGDKHQVDRDKIFLDFKAGRIQVLVATDVAARGLDVPSIRNVICWDPPRDKDAHTHRIGRTGRAGEKGAAYSLLTHQDSREAGMIVRSLQEVYPRCPEP
ncbi:P-loop containing nucleoside triphosphate hydrolase protein, partial [Baffinella frigidus]